jgi:hypothetical protein
VRSRRGVALLLTLVVSGCAARSFAPPTPSETPAPEGVRLWQQAMAPCAAITSVTAEAALSGRVGGARARGRVHLGLARDGHFRLEGVAPFGAPIFIMAGDARAATLVLPRDRRVVANAAPRDLIEALAGVALEPAELLDMVVGCLGHGDGASTAGEMQARKAGALTWVRTGGGTEAWLDTAGAAPVVVAAKREGLVVDYPQRTAALPQAFHFVRREGGAAPAADLTIRLTQVESNVSLPAAAFTVETPGDAKPMTLDELRRSGLFGSR